MTHSENSGSAILALEDLELDVDKRLLKRGSKKITLTYMQCELLQCLMNNCGNLIDDENILKALWGPDGPRNRTVENIKMHISKLRDRVEDFGVYIVRKRRCYGMLDKDGFIDGEEHENRASDRRLRIGSSRRNNNGNRDIHELAIMNLVPAVTLQKIRDENNAYGFDIIEILVFNYDGSGAAICRFDGELDSIRGDDLHYVLFGDPWTGERWYELINVRH